MVRRREEILELAANGLTDKQIASQLCVSVRTVESHWRRLREETGISNRSGLIGAALRLRLAQERSSFENQIAELQKSLIELRTNSSPGANHIDSQSNERSRQLHEELSTLYDQVNRLQARQIDGEILSSIVQQSSVLVYRLGYQPPHTVNYVSESVRQLGYRPDDFLGLATWPVLIHPDDFARVWGDALSEFKNGNRIIDRNYRMVARTGDIRKVYERAVLELDQSEKPVSIAAFAFDITHLGKIEVADKISTPTT